MINPYTGDDRFSFFARFNLRSGRGSALALPEEAAELGMRKPYVVVDPGVLQSENGSKVVESFEGKVQGRTTTRVEPNPKDTVIDGLADEAREHGADGVVGIGGGSAIDTAKGVALLLTNGGRLRDYAGKEKVAKRPVPVIAIPTTAGTGSEVTANAAITDSETHIKFAVRSKRVIPSVAILDPDLLATIPKGVAASSAVDALTHALEGYLSVRSTPLSDLVALDAMGLLWQNIRPFCANPRNVEAAEAMQLGSMLAGTVISSPNTGTGNAHALARALGGMHDTPHGLACALFMPAVLEFNYLARPRKYRQIADVLCLALEGKDSDHAVARAIVEQIRELLSDLDMPQRLSEVGVKEADLEPLADVALQNVGPNPRATGKEDLVKILQATF